ncbi:MAG: hypothetical protein ACI80M_001357 [Gammaproteobacteria bacterium]|jgi:hypothetical protein|tara:strand:+ start:4239 stop:4496 length:258 start_codon:yes stop_codon:yes gene_type:complete
MASGFFCEVRRLNSMWLSKPLYEVLPFFYLLAGVLLLGASIYLNYWYWPTICLIAGFVCLIGGLMVLLKRRDFRYNVPRDQVDED